MFSDGYLNPCRTQYRICIEKVSIPRFTISISPIATERLQGLTGTVFSVGGAVRVVDKKK